MGMKEVLDAALGIDREGEGSDVQESRLLEFEDPCECDCGANFQGGPHKSWCQSWTCDWNEDLGMRNESFDLNEEAPKWMSNTKPAATKRATPPPRKSKPEPKRATPPPRKSRDIKMSSIVSKGPEITKHDDDVFTMKSVANETAEPMVSNAPSCVDCGTMIGEGEQVCGNCYESFVVEHIYSGDDIAKVMNHSECEICGEMCPPDWNLCGEDECLNDAEYSNLPANQCPDCAEMTPNIDWDEYSGPCPHCGYENIDLYEY